MRIANRYRTHTCGDLTKAAVDKEVVLAGWVHRKRNHGSLLFVDLRDHYGITQIVAGPDSPSFDELSHLRLESVIRVEGKVAKRTDDTINMTLATGEIEVFLKAFEVLSQAAQLPFPVNSEEPYPEEIRLKYRYLDLRRKRNHEIIALRSKIVSDIRVAMVQRGFNDITTPILTATSPEGARDYVVPARLHPGKFYALPQAPQMFKQLLMVAGFEKYFQIAPCFRDESARADRSPGEFYQLDLEMSFVEQEDVLQLTESVLHEVFTKNTELPVDPLPFVRIPYDKSMLDYGSDKPDLRNPLKIVDVTEHFGREAASFSAFKELIAKGSIVRAIPAPGASARPRSFFDKLNEWARAELRLPGLGYMVFEEDNGALTVKGPIAKFMPAEIYREMAAKAGIGAGDALFFVCDAPVIAAKRAGDVRTRLGWDLGLIEEGQFRFCWIVDFPMYEQDEDTGQVVFSHNPFSMPQGGMKDLLEKSPLDIKAFQYDIVCNGMELGSGAIRNHHPEIMLKAFSLAGYSAEQTEQTFGSLLTAFRFGAPPHGGIAPGIDRIVMRLAHLPNIREGVVFPMSQNVEDLMMGAPTPLSDAHLKELHLKIVEPPKKS